MMRLPIKKKTKTSDQRRRGIAHGYRSGLEEQIAKQIESRGLPVMFEVFKLTYSKPVSTHRYTPDFRLPNGIIVETKGRFLPADRQKHLLVKAQHPELDIRFVFSRSAERISKSSKTTYADWCRKHGFVYADQRIPEAWFKENQE